MKTLTIKILRFQAEEMYREVGQAATLFHNLSRCIEQKLNVNNNEYPEPADDFQGIQTKIFEMVKSESKFSIVDKIKENILMLRNKNFELEQKITGNGYFIK